MLVAFGKALRLVVLPISVSAIAGIDFSFSPDSGAGLRALAYVVCAVWAIAIVSMTALAAWRARWHRCLGLLAMLLVVLPMSHMLVFWVGDYVHLAMMYPSYQSKIRTEPGRVTFEWKTVELMFAQVERTLVYDPSDREAQEKGFHNDYDGSFTRHRHLMGHFYLVENSPWRGCVLRTATRVKFIR